MRNKYKLFFAGAVLPCIGMLNASPINKEKPNIILIYCDDMGYGDLGVTGNPNIKTSSFGFGIQAV